MSIDTLLNRRRLLALSGSAAAGLAIGGMPRSALSAPSGPHALPIPTLIDARDGEPVNLSIQSSRHRFGADAVPSKGISSSYLGPVVRVRSGDTIPFRVENRLDEDTTLHWHGLMVPSHLDGGPHNTIKPGAVWSPEITVRQPSATTWFHPHPHGRVARQVYFGLAGMMIVSDGQDADRGLPVTYGLDDLPIVLQDKRFAPNGELVYEPTMMDLMHGFVGDTLLVNGAIVPTAAVPASFVRLRLLNAANARNFELAFSDGRKFHVIAGDSGLLAELVEVTSLVIAPAERYEVLVDFADGRAVEIVTGPDTHHGDGNMMMMHGASRPGGFGAATSMLMSFRPDPAMKQAVTRLPRQLASLASADRSSAVARRTFVLNAMMGMGMGMGGMPGMGGPGMHHGAPNLFSGPGLPMGINGRPFAMDRVDVTTKLGTAEIWEIAAPDMAHPFHVHGARFRVLSKNGRAPSAYEAGWKDTVLVGPHAELLVRFDQPASPNMPFMYHCHVLEHEDQGMMGQYAAV
jgi:FtsP/CotA-like multicopper oxidase with cupredoxin domain